MAYSAGGRKVKTTINNFKLGYELSPSDTKKFKLSRLFLRAKGDIAVDIGFKEATNE